MNIKIKSLLLPALSVGLVASSVVTITSNSRLKELKEDNRWLRGAYADLTAELIPYRRAERERQRLIALDDAHRILSDIDYRSIKWAFDNAPVNTQMAFAARLGDIDTYGDFLELTLDGQIQLVHKYLDLYYLTGTQRSAFLQRIFYMSASLADQVIKYKDSAKWQ